MGDFIFNININNGTNVYIVNECVQKCFKFVFFNERQIHE
jgi:hypothetical protein